MLFFMIGPHQGIELELMLSGAKPMAMFHDYVPQDGTNISEEIIPEAAFAPHVAAGKILRVARDITDTRTGDVVRYVLFTLPNEGWRANTLLWLRENIRNGTFPADNTADIITGRLLGYSEDDIGAFLEN